MRSVSGRFGMMKLCAALLFAAACHESAYADRPPAGPEIAIDVAPARQRAPYDVQVIREDGQLLPTYGLKDRFYVQGTAGERYTIRVTNPTAHRVEAVVSVDGLDAVDGEAGDLRKRGYIVPPHGTVNVEGFRTSLADVATFRFSSVDGSYAGMKGKARNVGVIAVAIFEETAPPPEPAPLTIGGNYNYQDDVDEAAPRGGAPTIDDARTYNGPVGHAAAKTAAPPPPPAPSTPASNGYAGGGATATGTVATAAPRAERGADKDYDGAADDASAPVEQQPARQTNRPGLGTQFGETRYSAASYTAFIRSSERPIAVAELRYNDAAGLIALGVPLQPMPDEYEIMTRESAEPFPGDHFAQPPR